MADSTPTASAATAEGAKDSSTLSGRSSTAHEQQRLVSFVAKDFEELVKQKSGSRPSSLDDSTIAESQSLASGNSSFPPSPYPPLLPDPHVLLDMEASALSIGSNLEKILEELNGTLHGMAHLTVQNEEVYASAVTRSCDSVDNAIKTTYQLMAKVEELTLKLRPVSNLHKQIKEIKRVLDLFEIHLSKSHG